MTRRKTPVIGWVLYGLLWLLLVANIVNDWMAQRWVSPVSLFLLMGLVGVLLFQRFTGRVVTYSFIAVLLVTMGIYLLVVTMQ